MRILSVKFILKYFTRKTMRLKSIKKWFLLIRDNALYHICGKTTKSIKDIKMKTARIGYT